MKRYNPRLITSRRSYTPDEIAKLLGINRKTISLWLKGGLQPLEANTRPLLIMGEELRRFLSEQKKKREVSLKENEFYCLKCRGAVLAKAGTEKKVPTGKKIGKRAVPQYFRRAKCKNCGTIINRLTGDSQKD